MNKLIYNKNKTRKSSWVTLVHMKSYLKTDYFVGMQVVCNMEKKNLFRFFYQKISITFDILSLRIITRFQILLVWNTEKMPSYKKRTPVWDLVGLIYSLMFTHVIQLTTPSINRALKLKTK